MAVRGSIVYSGLALMWFTIVLSKLHIPEPIVNLTASSGSAYKPVPIDWRSEALGKYSRSDNSTLSRRECWIMKVGPEDDYRQDVVKCTDKKAPTLAQLIAHGRNGTEYGKADAAHVPVFYTDWKNPVLGSAGGLAGTNPSERILWYINRSFKGYVSPNAGCKGGLVLNKKVYTYSDMTRDSWFVRTHKQWTISPSTDISQDCADGRTPESPGRLSRIRLSRIWIFTKDDTHLVLLPGTRPCRHAGEW